MDLCQVDCLKDLFSSYMVSKRETSHIWHTGTKHYSFNGFVMNRPAYRSDARRSQRKIDKNFGGYWLWR